MNTVDLHKASSSSQAHTATTEFCWYRVPGISVVALQTLSLSLLYTQRGFHDDSE
ncbi:hypothetical protein PUV47_16630 [Pseudovibrio exalbescens]|uniref:hypothetical protein n=1 Tax=Pseudovibrio exalbescens TaxID=197461 RepID=UPI002366DA31|nr:hypothetical protein [Pseudovibrio exalbescens]MDD7911558.1 hypothetical protein [Pseudovibrio exalbescens]